VENLEHYRQIVEQILLEYAAIPYAHGEIATEAIFDRQRDRYLLMDVGWDRGQRVYDPMIHVDIINGKFWVQEDNTDQPVALELVRAGVPKENIVLAFHEPKVRQYTEFAAA
jgi:hypothetical protein